MKEIELIATTTFGLEAITKRELEGLGYKDIKVENGRVMFKATLKDIAIVNLWLRTAERVLIKLDEFKAETFEELFNKTKKIDWSYWIPEDGNFIIQGKSIKSTLFSISDCQRIVEKSIVEKLKENYDIDWFEKSGSRYRIEVGLLKDIATITLDTSGEGLHKRGYRDQGSKAPIKETLAAAMVLLSYWNKDRVLYDPFCGSGTIAIEAAMIGKNIAPGLDRKFDFERWDIIDRKDIIEAKKDAFKAMKNDVDLKIIASDIDEISIRIAKNNATNLGLEDDITFIQKDMRDVELENNYGVVITNPPYGERIGEKEEVEKLYIDLGKKLNPLNTWSVYVITSDEDFEKLYGKKANRKRKLYNGRIKVDYYQYYGPRPENNNEM